MTYFTFNTIIELACFLAALVFLIKDKDPAWKLVIPYLLITFLVETIGLYLRQKGIPNLPIYNGFLVVECIFNSFFFFHLYKSYQNHLRWLVAWLCLFFILYFTELIYNDFSSFTSITASIMSVVFVLACLYFYYLKLKDETYEPLLASAPFWWISGALFFYFGSTVCNLFFDYLKQYEVGTYHRSVRYLIFNILNIILYSFWIFSFICRYRQKKSSR
jgi:hypothetical protein